MEVAIEQRGVFGRFERGDGVVNQLADFSAAVQANRTDLLGGQQVRHTEPGFRGIGVE